MKTDNVYNLYYLKMVAEYTAEANSNNFVNEDASQVIFEEPAHVQPVQPKRAIRLPPPDQYSLSRPYMTMKERYSSLLIIGKS